MFVKFYKQTRENEPGRREMIRYPDSNPPNPITGYREVTSIPTIEEGYTYRMFIQDSESEIEWYRKPQEGDSWEKVS